MQKRSIIAAMLLALFSGISYAEETMGKLRQLNLSDAIVVLQNGMEFDLDRELRKSFYKGENRESANSLQGQYVVLKWKRDKRADSGRVVTEIKPLYGKK